MWHAEGIGADEVREGKAGEIRGVLFWVNLARRDKDVEPTAQVVRPEDLPSAGTVMPSSGPWSARVAGRARDAGLILDVELPEGGTFGAPCLRLQRFVYLLEGEATSAPTASEPAIADRAPRCGRCLTVTDAQPGTRFMLMAGKPYGETPVYNGPFVD